MVPERTVTVLWEGVPVDASAPAPIETWDPDTCSLRTVRRAEQAVAAVRRVGDRETGALEVAARLLLRAEALASSAIEGLRATAADVAVAEAAGVAAGRDGNTAAWVADNLAVVADALADPRPLAAGVLHQWHRRLMRHSPAIDPRHVGAYRDALGWVGGPNPRLAAHVGAPPSAIPALMDDLFAFVARRDVDAVTQAALAHAQFETIHPFADGNGRLGRVLVGRILATRLGVPVPPPVSLELARDIGGYQAGLTRFRGGDIDPWVAWFAAAVETAGDRSADVLGQVAALQGRWRDATADLRADAAARRLVEILPAHPVVSAPTVARLLLVSEQAARGALAELAARNVVVEVATVPSTRGRPSRWFVADRLLALVGR